MAHSAYTAERFYEPPTEELRFLPEGPRVLRHLSSPGRPMLGWVAIQHAAEASSGGLNLLDLVSRENLTHPLPGRPGFFAETTKPGVVVIGLERRLVLYNLDTREVEETGIALPDDPRVIINDGLAVEGGVLFGSKHLEFSQPIAALYFADVRRRQLVEVLPGQFCSTGKMYSRHGNGATLIDIDSTPKRISRYRLDAEMKVAEQSLIIAPEALPAFPDGLRPAPDGGSILVAFYNPAAVADGGAWLIGLDHGSVLAEWRIPGSPRVTCPEFVEWDGEVKVLFTTAVEGMPDETRQLAPGAGCMYIADTPFETMPAPPPLVEV